MIECIFRPLERWPGRETPPDEVGRSPFKGSFTSTLDMMERELRHVGARDVIIQGYFRRDQIRNDGWPRSSATPSQPGVVLTFERDDGPPLRFATDVFNHWEANLRAIALGMEALRKVDRYGISRGHEQYRGFAALPPGGDIVPSVEDCIAVLAELSGLAPEEVRDDPKRAYRLMSMRHHPDKCDRADTEWRRGDAAYRMLIGGA